MNISQLSATTLAVASALGSDWVRVAGESPVK